MTPTCPENLHFLVRSPIYFPTFWAGLPSLLGPMLHQLSWAELLEPILWVTMGEIYLLGPLIHRSIIILKYSQESAPDSDPLRWIWVKRGHTKTGSYGVCIYIYIYTTKNLINICNIRESRFFAIDSFDPYTNVFDPSPTGTHLAEIMRIHLPCRSCADTWPWGESSVLFFAVATWRKALLEHAPFLRLACFLMAVRWLASANSWEMQIQPWQCNFYRASIK